MRIAFLVPEINRRWRRKGEGLLALFGCFQRFKSLFERWREGEKRTERKEGREIERRLPNDARFLKGKERK